MKHLVKNRCPTPGQLARASGENTQKLRYIAKSLDRLTAVNAENARKMRDLLTRSVNWLTVANGENARKLRDLLTRSVERLVIVNRENLRKLTQTNANSSVSRIKNQTVISEPKPCSSPWKNYRSLCVLLSKKKKTWAYARADCKKRGGDLVWFENAAEHDVINSFFYKNYGLHTCYHAGLFRARKGAPLTWTGGSTSRYRGRPLTFKYEVNFAPFSATTQIYGFSPISKHPFVCRR